MGRPSKSAMDVAKSTRSPSKRTKRSDLDSSVIQPGAKFCMAPECNKVYLSGRSHASKKQHSGFVRASTMEEWKQHCTVSLFRSKRMREHASGSVVHGSPNKVYTFNFGKHEGETLEHVLQRFPWYVNWLVTKTEIPKRKAQCQLKLALLEARIIQPVIGYSDDYTWGPVSPSRGRNVKPSPPPSIECNIINCDTDSSILQPLELDVQVRESVCSQ